MEIVNTILISLILIFLVVKGIDWKNKFWVMRENDIAYAICMWGRRGSDGGRKSIFIIKWRSQKKIRNKALKEELEYLESSGYTNDLKRSIRGNLSWIYSVKEVEKFRSTYGYINKEVFDDLCNERLNDFKGLKRRSHPLEKERGEL